MKSQKNFSARRGLACEEIVARHYLNSGWKIRQFREKIFSVQVDLLVEHSRKGLAVVEVKSLSDPSFQPYRVKPDQIRRLMGVVIALQSRNALGCDLHIAYVDAGNRVEVVPAAVWTGS